MLRLISWNVLADAYVRASFYPRTDPALRRPGARTSAILDAILADPADVFCMQEVEPVLVQAAQARLAGWGIHFEQKRGKPDGCAIFARPGITLEEVSALAFADGAPDREDSGHVALFATVRLGELHVRIATTHLRWDPPGTLAEQRWAIREVQELIAAMRAPAIVCGDLNVEADDDVYRMLLDAGFVDAHVGDALPTANPNGRAKRIDYILHTRELHATSISAVAIDDDTPLPSPTMPSDHVPIAVELSCADG